VTDDVRWKQRLANFEKAFAELESACSRSSFTKLERRGLIQTFEFTFELAWKTLQDLILIRGYAGPRGPRPVLEQAFSDGLIGQGDAWMDMLLSRNQTVHSYDEKTAEKIARGILDTYHPLLKALVERLRAESGT
jgi:nucleotidyltransferase substrate binding protein (TIGR01987 family)